MQKKIAIVSYQFQESNIRLQPWRYVYELARGLLKFDWSSVILTDSCKISKDHLEVDILGPVCLSPLGAQCILKAIEDISPNVVLWPLGPKSIGYFPLFRRMKQRLIGYFPGPILNVSDFKATLWTKLYGECLVAATWVLARGLSWAKAISSCFESFIVLSEANRLCLREMGIEDRRIHVITAGRETLETEGNLSAYVRSYNSTSHSLSNRTALFLGWPKRVRGIDLLLDGFAIAAGRDKQICLKILARGEKTPEHRRLCRIASDHPAWNRISIIEGFLGRDEVLRHIRGCNFGILPFIQVPADRPLSFLEFFSAGKPVISTDASGVPELIGDTRGKVSRRNDPNDLAEAMLEMASMPDSEHRKYEDACLSFSRGYPTWEDTTVELVSLINKESNAVKR